MESLCAICKRGPAEFTCSCTSPPVLVCSKCLGPHVETDGAHQPAPIHKKTAPRALPGTAACDSCQAKAAVRFCLCTLPLRKYCEECDTAHYKQAPLKDHSEHPMSTYTDVASGKIPLEVFKKKQQFINDFQLPLSQETARYDAFVAQVGEKFDALLALIATKKEAAMQDLQVKKAQAVTLVNTAKERIDAVRGRETFDPTSEFDEMLLKGYSLDAQPEISVFSGRVEMDNIPLQVQSAVSYNVAPNISLTVDIPVIKGTSLRLCNPLTFLMREVTTFLGRKYSLTGPLIDHTTAYCLLSMGSLLCCGGGGYTNAHNEVYKINILAAAVEQIAPMRQARSCVGIWNYRSKCVFVFGGFGGKALDTGEKYKLAGAWSDLPHHLQAAKYYCSVCEHNDFLYVAGIDNVAKKNSVEKFSPEDETFMLLRADNVLFAAIICSDGSNLYFIRGNSIERTDQTGARTSTQIEAVENGYYWLNCPMKWFGGELMSVLNPAGLPTGVFRFSPEKMQFAQVVTFTY